MKEYINKLFLYLFELYLKNEEQKVVFPKYFVLVLRIQQALLSLSYIYGSDISSYIQILSYFARPQQFLPESDVAQYVILVLCILYIINMFSIEHHSKYIGIFGELLKCSILNFVFEYSTGQISRITQAFLIFLSLAETLIFQGTLNAQTINFQNTRFSLLDFAIMLLNYIVMIFYSFRYSNQYIAVCALLISVLKALNQCINSPNKNLITKSILLTINIGTLYLAGMFFIKQDAAFTAEMILFPFIYRMVHAYYRTQFCYTMHQKKSKMMNVLFFLENIPDIKIMQLDKPQNPRDKIIYASLLMLQEKNYEGFLEISQIPSSELNFIERFKRNVIMKQCMVKINWKIQMQTHTQNKIAFAVASLMASEESNCQIQSEILHILKDKIKCQQLLLQNQHLSHYRQYLQFTQKLLLTKNKLEKQYDEFPCDKTQGILGFFYVEVMNDYLAANQLYSIIALSDEKVKRMITNQDIFSNKMVYLVSTLQTYNGNLIVKRPSNDAPEFFYKTQEQLTGKSVCQLIPPGVAEHHDKLVVAFLQKGEAKFLRQIAHNYLYNSDLQTMMSIEFTFEIDLRNDFSFISFIQPANHQRMAFVVNSQHRISCISDALVQNLRLTSFQSYLGILAKTILPDFPYQLQDYQMIENVEAHFPIFEDLPYKSSGSIQSTTFLTSYTIQQFIFQDQALYFIITFEFFKRPQNQLQQSQSAFSPTQYCAKDQEYEQNIMIDVGQESVIRIPYREMLIDRKNTNSYYRPSQKDIRIRSSKQIEHTINNELKLFSQLEYTNLMSPGKQEKQDLLPEKNEQQYFTKPNIHKTKLRISVQEEICSQNEEIVYQDDQQSQVSSLQGARRSKYYKKFEIFAKIHELQSFSNNHKMFIGVFIFCIIFQLVIQIIQITEMNNSLTNLANDIDLLQIKNFVFQPLETFLVTRWTIVNYNLLRDTKVINLTTYTELVKFPRSNLKMGYDQLDQNLKLVFDRSQLQDFLENTYLDVYIYRQTSQGDLYNISLRNSINILLNYQYTFKMAYIVDGAAVADSAYVYYSYRNYLPLKLLFSQLNEIVLQQSIVRAKSIYYQMQAIYLISIIILFLIMIFAMSYFLKIAKNINKYYQLMHNISSQYIENDQIRLKSLIEKINRNQNTLFKYLFNLDQKEKQLESNIQSVATIKRTNASLQSVNSHDIYYYIFILIVVTLIIGNASLTFFEGQHYLSKYPDTAQFFKALSDVGTDVPTMYAQRDVLYGRANFAFFNQNDYDNIMIQIKDALARTAQFLSVDIDFSKYLVSNTFANLFKNIEQQNLCDYLPDELEARSATLCPLVMNQNMQRGLKTVLVYMVNFISTDLAINQFTTRTQPSYLELEGGFLVSNIIQLINDQFHIDLDDQTFGLTQQINIHNIIILITLLGIILSLATTIKNKLTNKLLIVQRLIYILPMKTVFFDDVFERNIRQLLQNQ